MAYRRYCLCNCSKCDSVQKYMDQNIWFHKSHFTDTLNLSGNVKGIISPYKGSNIPISPDTSHGSDTKPLYALWFSHGSWLFDPYCDLDHDKKIYSVRIIKIENPKNILNINSPEELENFIDTYGLFSKYNTRYVYGITWDKIKEDGFFGVAFNFRKVDELGFDRFDHRYRWHMGYDVESLMIFDVKAFDDEVMFTEIKI